MRGSPALPALLAVLVPLAGCGRVGPIQPPGPPSALVYPRAYPYFPPGAVPGAAAVPAESLTPGAPTAEQPVERGDIPIARPASPR
ncbi:hypothetical protein ACFQX4_05955 [Roseomonas sp. GCM10028921]